MSSGGDGDISKDDMMTGGSLKWLKIRMTSFMYSSLERELPRNFSFFKFEYACNFIQKKNSFSEKHMGWGYLIQQNLSKVLQYSKQAYSYSLWNETDPNHISILFVEKWIKIVGMIFQRAHKCFQKITLCSLHNISMNKKLIGLGYVPFEKGHL